jgi:hypothetical protein
MSSAAPRRCETAVQRAAETVGQRLRKVTSGKPSDGVDGIATGDPFARPVELR